MKFSRLEQASYYEVKDWMNKELGLNDYQKQKIDAELIRLGPFCFYKQVEYTKPTLLCRMTIPLFIVIWLGLLIINPLKWFFTGKWGYNQKFIDKYYYSWIRKLGI